MAISDYVGGGNNHSFLQTNAFVNLSNNIIREYASNFTNNPMPSLYGPSADDKKTYNGIPGSFKPKDLLDSAIRVTGEGIKQRALQFVNVS